MSCPSISDFLFRSHLHGLAFFLLFFQGEQKGILG